MRKTLNLLSLLLMLGALPAVAKDTPIPAIDPTYKVIAGDVLQVTVWKEDGLDREVLVLPDGSFSFPLIGTVEAQGRTTLQLQDIIKNRLGTLIPDASVSVAVKAALGHTVSVIGQVTKPGEFVIGHSMSAMQALSQAGGLTPYASESDIIVIRHDAAGKEFSIPLPYDDISEGKHLDKDLVLAPGDVLVVPTASLF
jgi:polysaccharide export outer membrane protein